MPREPQCLYGSERSASAPTWHQYTYTELGSIIGQVADLATATAMGLPTGPFSVDEFCAIEPLGDLPTAEDYAKLAFPPVALVTGSYERMGNQVKADTFAQFCVCKANPAPPACHEPDFNPSVSGPISFTINQTWLWSDFQVSAPIELREAYVWKSANVLTYRLWNVTDNVEQFYHWGGETHVTGLRYFVGEGNAGARPVLVPGKQYRLGLHYSANETWHYLAKATAYYPTDEAQRVVWGTMYWQMVGQGLQVFSNDHVIPFMFAYCDPPSVPYDPTLPPPLTPPTGYPTGTPNNCADGSSICAKIDQLSNWMAVLLTRIDLIQRQIVPFAYIPGTSHNGLQGSGSFAVQGILGLRVSLTSVPAYLGVKGTASPTIFEAGYITVGTPDGDLRSEPIYKEQYVMLDISPAVTSVTYDLAPGVTASILELVREP